MKQWLLRVLSKYITPRTNVNNQKILQHETDVLVLMERYGSLYDDALKGIKDERRT